MSENSDNSENMRKSTLEVVMQLHFLFSSNLVYQWLLDENLWKSTLELDFNMCPFGMCEETEEESFSD